MRAPQRPHTGSHRKASRLCPYGEWTVKRCASSGTAGLCLPTTAEETKRMAGRRNGRLVQICIRKNFLLSFGAQCVFTFLIASCSTLRSPAHSNEDFYCALFATPGWPFVLRFLCIKYRQGLSHPKPPAHCSKEDQRAACP